MADVFQPIISAPQAGAAAYVPSMKEQAAAADTSGIDFTKFLAGQAMDAWQGYEQARLLGPDVIDNPEAGKLADVEVKDGNVVEIKPTAILNLNNIAAARKQGTISAEAARVLVTAAVKEASARMPGMAEQFRQEAANFFGSYAPGWGLLESQEDSAAKQAEKMQMKYLESVHQTAKDYGVANPEKVWEGEEGLKEVMKGIEDIRPLIEQEQTWKRLSAVRTAQEPFTKDQARAAAPGYISSQVISAHKEIEQFIGAPMEKLYNITNAVDKAAVVSRLGDWRIAKLAEYRKIFPEGAEEALADYKSYLDGVVANLTKLADGTARVEDAKSQFETFKYTAAMRVAGLDPDTFGYLTGVQMLAPGVIGTPVMKLLEGSLGVNAKNAYSAFKMANVDGLSMYNPYNKKEVIEGTQELVKETAQALDGVKDPSKEQSDGFFSQVNAMIDGLENTGTKGITNEHYAKAFDLVGSVDWPKWKKVNPDKAAEIEDKLAEVIDAHAFRSGKNLTIWANSNPDMAGKMEFTVGPSQRIVIMPKKSLPAAERNAVALAAKDLNSKYNFGAVSKAWAVIYGKPQIDLLKELAQSGYFPSTVGFAGAGDRDEQP